MVFQWSLSEKKSSKVSRSLLRILADLNNAVVRRVFSCPLISNSSSPSCNPLVTVTRGPISLVSRSLSYSIVVVFFQLSSKVQVLIFSLSFNFTLWSAGTAKSINQHFSFLSFCWPSLCLVVWLGLHDPFDFHLDYYYYYYLLIRVFLIR